MAAEATLPMPEPQAKADLERAALAPTAGDGKASSYGSIASDLKPIAASAEEEIQDQDPHQLLRKQEDGRYPYLDITRIICVWLVSVDHGGTTFGIYNTMYVQSWVLQYLYLICGICFGMTSKGLFGFVARLSLYFCVGVGCNVCAFIILGKEWKGDMWNVVFQFWFIVALIIFAVLLAPLKAHIEKYQEMRSAQSTEGVGFNIKSLDLGPKSGLMALVVGYLLSAMLYMHVFVPVFQLMLAGPLASAVSNALGPAAVFWGLPSTPAQAEDFISVFCTYFQVSLSNVYIVVACPIIGTELSWIGWLVIFNTYSHKMIQYRAQEARLITGFDAMMLGLVCFHYGLKHRREIGKYMVRYWFLVLFISALLWPPGTVGRFDENPPKDLEFRIRYNALEGLFIVLFLTAAERMFDSHIFLQDRLEFLSDWALLLYLVHKAIHLLIPAPFNFALLLLIALPCYFTRKGSAKRPRAAPAAIKA